MRSDSHPGQSSAKDDITRANRSCGRRTLSHASLALPHASGFEGAKGAKASTAMHAEAEIGLIRQDGPSWPGHPHSRAGMTVLSHKRL
jgi:hypothetical protein